MIPIPIGTTLASSEKREMAMPTRMKINPSNTTNSLAWSGVNMLSD